MERQKKQTIYTPKDIQTEKKTHTDRRINSQMDKQATRHADK